MASSTAAPLVRAHALAVAAEDLHDEGRWREAAQKLEAAAEQYVRATLTTSDVASLQSLRLLAISHSQRAHELRCRITLCDAHEEAAAAAAPPPPALPPLTASAEAAEGGAGSGSGEGRGSFGTHSGSGGAAANAALSRLGSHLMSTLDALHFGAEELACAELLLPPQSASSSRISLGGGLLTDSYCVVPPCSGERSPAGAAASAGAAGGAAGGGEHDERLRAQLAVLTGEKAALKQRCAEMQAALAKVQRRGSEQLRLAKKALSVVREVHSAPRPDLAPPAAAEIKSLRAQLEAAHAAQRQQAEVVRKYESRWAQLKASARRKQQLKDQQAAAAAQLGSSQAQAPPQLAAAPGSPSGASAPPRRAHFGALVHSFAAG